jgi:hypothetical protein
MPGIVARPQRDGTHRVRRRAIIESLAVKHDYSLANFGLTADGVREHFRDYIERFSP